MVLTKFFQPVYFVGGILFVRICNCMAHTQNPQNSPLICYYKNAFFAISQLSPIIYGQLTSDEIPTGAQHYMPAQTLLLISWMRSVTGESLNFLLTSL